MSILDELGIDRDAIDDDAEIGEPVEGEIEGMRVYDIPVAYRYKGKRKTFSVRVVPDRQISTVTEKTEGEYDRMEVRIITEGMTREELVALFPSTSSRSDYDFNLTAVYRSIIYEAYLNREIDYLPTSNVRGFWYTHLIHVTESILGLAETDSVKSTINGAWEDLIVSGLVTYEDLNIESGKSSFTHSVVKDSPFANIIIAVEKEDKFKAMQWIPKLFNCTLITAGGQPSRSNARQFIRELRDDARVDLDQDFFICVVSDLDPAGYYIQEAFVNQLEKAIQFYGGSGRIVRPINRLFVRKDQVTQELLDHDAVPCIDKAKTPQAKKSEDTKWEKFCELTGGGIYKNVPRSVAVSYGAISSSQHLGESHVKVRAKLELNAFPDSIINRRVVAELLKIIHDTSDESLIMIPEIMRIFEQERAKAMEEIFKQEHDEQISPIMEEFLRIIDRAMNRVRHEKYTEEDEIEAEFEANKEEVSEPFEERIEELREEANARVPEELAHKSDILRQIEELQSQLYDVNQEIKEKTQDLLDLIQEQENEMAEAVQPYEDERDEKLEEAEMKAEYKITELEKFKREKETLFNPLEMTLRDDIHLKVSQPNMPFFFDNLEEDDDTAKHIGKMLRTPQRLLVEKIPCLEHTYPVFKETNLLQKASSDMRDSIEPYRRGFTTDFLDSMRILVHHRVMDDGVSFEIGELEELEGFDDELNELMDRLEEDIENGKHNNDEE